MRPEIAKLWKEALRSGKYKQVQGYLAKKKTEDEEYSYCCMGVLCEIYYLKNPEFLVNKTHLKKSYGYLPDSYQLPYDVRKWAGMKTTTGSLPNIELTVGTKKNLIALNDSGSTFDEIADVICKNQEEL